MPKNIEMDLCRILQDIQLEQAPEEGPSPGAEGLYSPRPVVEVLGRVQESLRAPGLMPEHYGRILHSLEQLFRAGDAHWLLSGCCTNQGTDLRRAYVGLVSSLTQLADLPLCETDSGSLPDSSYEGIPSRACAVSSILSALLHRLRDGGEAAPGSTPSPASSAPGSSPCPASSAPGSSPCPASSRASLARPLAPLCCVFAVSHMQRQAWTSQASRAAASDLLACVLRAGGWENTAQLLAGKEATDTDIGTGTVTGQQTRGETGGVLGAVLEILQPDLKKESWKRNQATKQVFSWLLLQVCRPWLAGHLDKVFPPSLLMSDDYCSENRVLGVRCLHHIVLNVPAADLRQYNRAQVLYHALFNHLYTPEAQLIQTVLLCLLDLLPVLEKAPTCTGVPRKPSRYDEVFRLMLTHMEVEHKLALRKVYASCLLLFIHRMGVVVVRHLKRLERVLTGYLEVSEGPEEHTRLCILDALESTLRIAWPRMESRVCVLVRSLLRLLCDVSAEPLPPAVRDQLVTKATCCLLLLDHCTQGKLKTLLQEVDSSCTSGPVLRCLETITMGQSRPTWSPTLHEHLQS